MTAPVANPSWSLKIERVQRRIRAAERQKAAPGADVAALDRAITGFRSEIEALQRAQVAAYTAERPDMSRSGYARAFGIKVSP